MSHPPSKKSHPSPIAPKKAVAKAKSHIEKKPPVPVFDTYPEEEHKPEEKKEQTMSASSAPVAAPAVKREMTKAEAEAVLDRLHYCKKHGLKMKADEHGAWHCETDDKEQAAAEEAEAKEAFAVFSKK